MATRATYEFSQDRRTFYIHYDGYPQGAATYFARMTRVDDPVYATNADKFAHANERAEITGSHETHGDTEYRYTLNGDTLTVHRREYRDANGKRAVRHCLLLGRLRR